MKKKLIKITSILLVMSLILAGCGNSDTENGESYEKPKFLTIGTAGTGGAYYPIGIAMADVITNNMDIQTTAQVTGGAVENNILLQDGGVDLAITQGHMAYASYNGTEPYEEKNENISILFSGLSQGVFQVVVKESSGINSMADLKGKRVVMGPAGGGAINVFNDVAKEYGFDINDIQATYISYTEGTEALNDGNVDAVLVQAAIPSAAITQLAATSKDFKLISIEEDILETITTKYPYYSESIIGTDIYGASEDVTTIYLSNMVVIDKTVSEEFVYNMMEIMFDNIDQITSSHPAASGLTLESAVESLPIPLHPGAEKYFKDKGVL
jgi:hypothetical protein